MRALAIDKYRDSLKLRHGPNYQLGPGQFVVTVAATTVNPFDAELRDGAFKALLPMAMPPIWVARNMSLSQPDA